MNQSMVEAEAAAYEEMDKTGSMYLLTNRNIALSREIDIKIT
jgi:hypothetical protein